MDENIRDVLYDGYGIGIPTQEPIFHFRLYDAPD
jgi:hypothetical protein